MNIDQKIEHILAIVGALVPLLSAAASFINHIIRAKTDAGHQVSPVVLHAGAFLNVASVNLDKAVQLGKMARGKSAPSTVAQPPAPESPPSVPPSAG